MTDVALVQVAYTTILKHFITHRRAPHYTELAKTLGIPLHDARNLVKEAAEAAPVASCWLSHDTDYIESWAPFSNVPTHNYIYVDGEGPWFGQ
jgi:hypothetical protein